MKKIEVSKKIIRKFNERITKKRRRTSICPTEDWKIINSILNKKSNFISDKIIFSVYIKFKLFNDI